MVNKCAGLQVLVEKMESEDHLQVAQALREPYDECLKTLPKERFAKFRIRLLHARNFLLAMLRWAAIRFHVCTKKQIRERYAHCRVCLHHKENRCELCGCPCNPAGSLLNKLALPSEECPIGKWGKVE